MSSNYSPRGFSFLPPVVKNLLIINVLVFVAALILQHSKGIDLNNLFGLHFFKAESFKPYQYLTYMFLHDTRSWSHIFFNMFALWMFGYVLENFWGAKRFLIYYLVTGIGAGIVQQIVWYIDLREILTASDEIINVAGIGLVDKKVLLNQFITVGASGAVYGILLAFGMMFPNTLLYIYFLFPIKAKWFVIAYGAIELFSGIRGNDGIAHFAHLGGMIFGIILILLWRHKGKKDGYQEF